MANIIDQIIAIDTTAQKKLDEANRFRDQYAADTEQKIAALSVKIAADEAGAIENVRSEEEMLIASQKEQIAAECDAEIRRLEQIYEKTHLQLEKKLFENVLGLSSPASNGTESPH